MTILPRKILVAVDFGDASANAVAIGTGVAGEDALAAQARVNATWAAIPVPVPRTAEWRSRVGEPLLQKCAIPVLFIPEADGGPAR